jgi:PilZ domain
MERRRYPRVPAQLQGFLLGNSHEVEGQTIDLSLGGAQFDCDMEVYPGKVIRVRLTIPGLAESLNIEEARVQWVGDDTFGVEFKNVTPNELDELEQLIDDYIATEEGGHA